MITFIVAAALSIVFIVSLIMTTEAVPRRRLAMKRVSLAVLILGTFVLGTACSTTHKGTTASRYGGEKPVGYVKRAVFTTAIKKWKPTDNISELGNNKQKIYFFTELRGMQGQKVKHRWIYKGKVRAEAEFKVKKQSWSVYSSKKLKSGWLGEWTVLTVDRRGRTLSRNKFSYTKAKGIFGKAGKLYNDLFGKD
jgi:hypothetical protein